MYLRRYHDVEISGSTIWPILHRLNIGRLLTSQRYQRHGPAQEAAPAGASNCETQDATDQTKHQVSAPC